MHRRQMNTENTPIGFVAPSEIAGMAKDTPVLVAFSGGSDSSALLDMLVKLNVPVYAAHVDHLIREGEHERDRLFCEKIADKYGVKLFTLTYDIPQEAQKTGESIELCARRIRYDFFEKIMKENKIPLLATAHNADDNLETLLMSLMRGSGTKGMCGIPKKREFANGYIVRPILEMSKDEIIEYCDHNGVAYVIDSTNALPDCNRNRLRLNVIPELKKINPSVVKNATRLTENLRLDSEELERLSKELQKPQGLSVNEINSVSPALRARAFKDLFGNECDLEKVHIDALTKLCRNGVVHSSLSLPNKKTAVIENGFLQLKQNTVKHDDKPYRIELCEGENTVSGDMKIVICHNDTNIYNYETKVSIPSDKIIGCLYARNRQSGDRIMIHGVNKSVKKLMCDRHVPNELRNRLPIICDDNGIVFIPFIGIRDGLSKKTKNISEMTYITLIIG